jgi:hypothetical protein
MAMSHDTRRRVIFVVAALLVVALVLASTGCSTSSSTDGTSTNSSEGDEIGGAIYSEAMNAICAETDRRLAELPTPPDEISQGDWALEVSSALRDEAAAFDEIQVGSDRRDDHASFVDNTAEQAELWLDVSDALADDPDGSTAMVDSVTNIAELTLGRNDLASDMMLSGCQVRDLG